MNMNLLLLCGISAALVSCSTLDPEYAQYKKDKQNADTTEDSPGGGDPYSNISNPYGVPSSAPQSSGEVGKYSPDPSTPPYQPLPGVPSTSGSYPTIPSSNPSAYSGALGTNPGTVSTHVVAKGDSLWALSRKYGASVDSIRQANGLTSDMIRVGQTLQIPR